MALPRIPHHPQASAYAKRDPRNCRAHRRRRPRHIICIHTLAPINSTHMKMRCASPCRNGFLRGSGHFLRRTWHTRMLSARPAPVQRNFNQHKNPFGLRQHAAAFSRARLASRRPKTIQKKKSRATCARLPHPGVNFVQAEVRSQHAAPVPLIHIRATRTTAPRRRT